MHENESLVSLVLSNSEGQLKNLFSSSILEHLQELFYHNHTLAFLDISNNRIMNKGLRHVVKALSNIETVVGLNLQNTGLTNGGAKLFRILVETMRLQEINVSKNKIGSMGATAIIEASLFSDAHKHYLIRLNMGHCNIGQEALALIF